VKCIKIRTHKRRSLLSACGSGAEKEVAEKSPSPFWVTVTSFLQMKSFRKFFVRAMHGKIHPKKKAPFSSSDFLSEKRSVTHSRSSL
jgi:hypothetical protein